MTTPRPMQRRRGHGARSERRLLSAAIDLSVMA